MFSQDISSLSYSGGGIIFGVLFFVTVYTYRKQQTHILLSVAVLFSAAFNFFVGFSDNYPQYVHYIPILEILKSGAWFAAILSSLSLGSASPMPKRFYWLIHGLWLALLAINLLSLSYSQTIELAINPLYTWNGLFLSILGLVSVEQLYRNTDQERHVKLLCISAGSIFLYDLYLFAHGLVFKQIDYDLWYARGAIGGTSALLLTVGLLTFVNSPEQRTSISISRPIAFYSTSLTTAGFFLSLMAAGGYYIKLYGGTWGVILQVVLIFSACVGIVVIFVSRTIRTRLSVIIDKNFFNHKYDYRTEWLRLIHYLSLPSDEGDFHKRAIKAVASTFRSPGGCVWMDNGSGGYWPAATHNLALPNIDISEPKNSDFCSALKNQEWVFSPSADSTNQTSNMNELLPGWVNNIQNLWILLPLLNDNELIGFMGLAKPPLETQLTWEDLDLLKTVGRQVSSYIARHTSAEQLAESKQFDAYNKLTAFVMHDLKNLIAQQALVVENAAKHKENPAFIEDAISTIDNSVKRMSNLLQKLQQKDQPGTPSTPSFGSIEINKVLVDACNKCHENYPIPSLRLADTSPKLPVDRDRFEMVMVHLIKNAQEATSKDGFIDVTLSVNSNSIKIEVEDNGEGMSQQFIKERLFKPFDSTKSGKGMGIGVYQARELIKVLGGDFSVESTPGEGTLFILTIPLTQH